MSSREAVLGLFRAEGFPLVRIAGVDALTEARVAALAAEAAGLLDGMAWITPEWLTRATAPASFLPGARSVVLTALPYAPGAIGPAVPEIPLGFGRVAAYAAGRDYHRVFEKRLRRAAQRLRDEHGARARATVDYGPLLERPLARLAGLGWQGKSTMLLAPGYGPWLLLGAVATDLELEPDPSLRKSCGACRRCIVACPTGALEGDGGTLDARRCISYHTIENRGPIPRELRSHFGAWIFGCDLCLEACPPGWRPFAPTAELAPASEGDATPELAPLLSLTEAEFLERYRGRSIIRAKRDGFLRNVCIALGNVGAEGDLSALLAAFDDRSELVRGHAAWAAARLALRLRDAAALDRVRSALRELLTDSASAVREESRLALADLGPAITPGARRPSA